MNRRTLLITAGASVVLIAVWFFALWQPKGAELAEEQERVELAEAQASELETRLVKLQQAKANAPKLVAQRDRLRSAVPDAPNLPQLILDANDAAIASGVGFISIAPTPPAPSAVPGLPPEVALNVQIEGGYFQVLDFVERLTDMQRIVVLDSVSVTPAGQDAGAPQLSVSLAGRMFTTQLPAAAGATDPAAGAASSTPAPAPAPAPATSEVSS